MPSNYFGSYRLKVSNIPLERCESQLSNGVLLKLWVNSAPYLWYVSTPKYWTHLNLYLDDGGLPLDVAQVALREEHLDDRVYTHPDVHIRCPIMS